MTDFTTLALERRGAIEILSLDRPDSLNAISPEMVEEASAYFSGLYDRLDVRVVILRGTAARSRRAPISARSPSPNPATDGPSVRWRCRSAIPV